MVCMFRWRQNIGHFGKDVIVMGVHGHQTAVAASNWSGQLGLESAPPQLLSWRFQHVTDASLFLCSKNVAITFPLSLGILGFIRIRAMVDLIWAWTPAVFSTSEKTWSAHREGSGKQQREGSGKAAGTAIREGSGNSDK